jgi:hypothetical protein
MSESVEPTYDSSIIVSPRRDVNEIPAEPEEALARFIHASLKAGTAPGYYKPFANNAR